MDNSALRPRMAALHPCRISVSTWILQIPPLLAPVQKTTLSLKMSGLKIDSLRTDMVYHVVLELRLMVLVAIAVAAVVVDIGMKGK